MGRRMGQGGQEGRLGEADAAARVRGFTSPMGGGADLLMVGPEQTDEQGLREAVRQRGSVRVRGDDSADGEEVGSWLRISKQFRKGSSPKLDFRVTEFSEVRGSNLSRSNPSRRLRPWGASLPPIRARTPSCSGASARSVVNVLGAAHVLLEEGLGGGK